MLFGDTRDRWHVLNFEGQRSRGFEIYDSGVRFHKRPDRATDNAVVIGDLNPELGKHIVAELACRRVELVWHEQMIAGFQKGHKRGGNSTKPAWQGHCAISPFELGDRLLECAGRRSSFATIGDAF